MIPVPGSKNSRKTDYSDILTDSICNRLNDLLVFPRSGAKRYKNRWSRGRHAVYKRQTLIKHLQRGDPLAASYFRIVNHGKEYSYLSLMNFAVIDADFSLLPSSPRYKEVRELFIRGVEKIYWAAIEHGSYPCLTHSGKKGYHIWIFFDEAIHAGHVRALFRDILLDAGLEKKSGVWLYDEFWDETGEEVDNNKHWVAEFDPLIKADGSKGGVVKIPFSVHQADPDLMELPITIEDLRTYIPQRNTTDDIITRAVEVFKTWKVTPKEIIEEDYPKIKEVSVDGLARYKRGGMRLPMFEFNTPEKGSEGYHDLFDRFFYLYYRLPCFQTAVDKSKTKESKYHLRTPIVQMMASHGFKDHEIAECFQLFINDEEDNKNPGTLTEQIRYWYPKQYLVKCSSYDNPEYSTHCCPGYCGRDSPKDVDIHDKRLLDIPPQDERSVEGVLIDYDGKDDHLQIFKSTRSGTTTRISLHVLDQDEQMLAVGPTNKLIETYQRMLDIHYAEGGKDKYVGCLPDNRVSCLKLMQEIYKNRELFGVDKTALEKLPFVSKFDCADCEYRESYLELDPTKINYESDLVNNLCLYTTVIHYLGMYDLLYLTDKKLRALIKSAMMISEVEPEIETDAELVLNWIQECDRILLDEISMYVDIPDVSLKVLEITAEDRMTIFNVVETLNEETQTLLNFKNDNLSNSLSELSLKLVDEFKQAKKVKDVIVFNRDVDDIETEDVLRFLKRIQTVAKKNDVALSTLFRSIMISQELEWIVVDEPTNDLRRNVSVYIRPKFGDVIAPYLMGTNAQIIATDATMPLTPLEDIMKIPFTKINIGDPIGNHLQMRMVSYPGHIKSPQLLHDKEIDQLKRTLEMIGEIWHHDKYMVSVPNSKKSFRAIKMDIDRDIDCIWYRGSQTVGVESEKRIMLGITSPLAPRGIFNWRKEVLYREELKNYTHDEIWRYDMIRSVIQTASRIKDPFLLLRSVFGGFGMNRHELEDVKANFVGAPDIIETVKLNDPSERHIPFVLNMAFWIEFGEELTKPEQIAASRLWLDINSDIEKVRRNVRDGNSNIKKARLIEIRDKIFRLMRLK